MVQAIKVDQERKPGQASRNSNTSVGTASGIVIDAQNFRKEAIFINDSTNIIYLAKGPFAAINTGIRLNANGGSYVLQPDTTGRIYTGPISAIATGATSNLSWTEDW